MSLVIENRKPMYGINYIEGSDFGIPFYGVSMPIILNQNELETFKSELKEIDKTMTLTNKHSDMGDYLYIEFICLPRDIRYRLFRREDKTILAVENFSRESKLFRDDKETLKEYILFDVFIRKTILGRKIREKWKKDDDKIKDLETEKRLEEITPTISE